MENDYQYLDPDFRYSSKNGILFNLANIEDETILIAFESFKLSRRIEDLIESPIRIKDSSSLLKIHHYLF